ncbi:E3 ubiquitin-protein ligase ubr1, partial [Basidiobolus ranarum]
ALFPDKDDLFLSDYCENDYKYSEAHRGKPCGHVFRRGEAIYWCRTCGLDDTCVLCSRCFQATDHQDHDTNFSINSGSGGCCDCGDFEAWKIPLRCVYHSPDYESSDDKSSTESEVDANQGIPEDLLISMRETIATVLDFILETCLLSPTRWHEQVFDLESIRREALTSGVYISPEEVEQTTYACILWNDESHNFDEVIAQIREATGGSTREATKIANKANSHGRAIVEISTDVERLIHIATSLFSIGLHVTIRSGRDTFREEVTGMLIDWLKELCSARRGEITSAYHGKVSDSLIQIVGDELGETWRNQPVNIKEILGISTFISEEIVRFDQLLLYDACLWKEAKVTLREFYVSLFANAPELKKFIASRFAITYTKLCENFLINDQELEESIMLFTVQIFTVPTLSAMLVREYSFITTMLVILRSYFLRGEILPQEAIDTVGALVDCESAAMSSRKYFHIFDDFRYLTCSENVKSIVPHEPLFLSQYIEFVSIFQGMNPIKRYVNQHIEFETQVAENAMNATLYLAELNRHFAGCYGNDGKMLGDAILRIVGQISFWMNFTRPGEFVYSPPSFKSERGITIIDYQVHSQFVSFHHPLHWFFGHLLENIECLQEETLRKYSWKSLFDLFKSGTLVEEAPDEGTKRLLMIFDHPIRVCALLAQIRAGIWVRNGFEIKDQAEQYLDPSLRENTFDLDLLIVQAAFSVLAPEQIILTILDRYALLDWFNGNLNSTLYDKPQMSVMIEELLHLFIICIGERFIIAKASMRERVMREIIHGCVRPIAYSELTERISERLTEYEAFDEILKQVTHFRPPDGVSDHGLYELEPEYYDKIDPYFIHYTRQDRDEAEEILKKRANSESILHVPTLLSLDDTPFSGLSNVIESRVFY